MLAVGAAGIARHSRNQQQQQQRIPAGRHQPKPRRNHSVNEDNYNEPSEQSVPDDISSMHEEYLDQGNDDIENVSMYSDSPTDDMRSELSSVFDPTIGKAVESRVKIFTDSLKSFLYQEAMKLRREEKLANSHQITFSDLSETVSRSLLERAFQRESNRSGGRDDKLMTLKSFCK